MADLLREYVIRLGWETKGADAVRAQVDAQNKAFFKQSEFLDSISKKQNQLNLASKASWAGVAAAVNAAKTATTAATAATTGAAAATTGAAAATTRAATATTAHATATNRQAQALGGLIRVLGGLRNAATHANTAVTLLAGTAQLLVIGGQRAAAAMTGAGAATTRATSAHRAAMGPLNALIRQIQILGTTYLGVHAITSTIKELGALHDQSRRVGASVNNIRAFEHAWVAAGGSVAEAASAMESLKEARIQPGNEALLRHFGVTAEDTAEQLLQLGKAYAGMPLFVAVNFGQRFGQSASQVKMLRDQHATLSVEYAKNVKFLAAFGVDAATAARNSKELAVQVSKFGMGMAQVRDAFFLGPAGAGGGFFDKLNGWLEGGGGKALAKFASDMGAALGEWIDKEGESFIKWLTAVTTAGTPESEGWKRFFTEIKDGATTSAREVLALAGALGRVLGFARDLDRFFSSKGAVGEAGRAARGAIGLPKTTLDIEAEGPLTGGDPESLRRQEQARMEQLRQARAREEGKSIWRRLLETFSTDIKRYDDFGDPGTAPAPDTASPEARDYIRRRRGEIGGSEGTGVLAGGIAADQLESIEGNTEETVKELKRAGSIWERIGNMLPSWAEMGARRDGGGGGGGGGGGESARGGQSGSSVISGRAARGRARAGGPGGAGGVAPSADAAGKAAQVAEHFLGKGEVPDRAELQSFMAKNGMPTDPATTAWCAAFVNASLATQGITGTGSRVATSFSNWGEGVADPSKVQSGDVMVQPKGRGAGETGGHVGIATGQSRMGPRGLQLQMISGNKADAVRKTWENASEIVLRRAVVRAENQAKAVINADAPTTAGPVSKTPVAPTNPEAATAGLRNANFGNLKFSSRSASLYPGVLGPSRNTDEGDPQIVFKDLNSGIKAADALLQRKIAAGKTTIRDLVAGQGGWTPGNVGAAANIARSAGIGLDDQIDASPATRARILAGIGKQEHGPAAKAWDAGALEKVITPPKPIGKPAGDLLPWAGNDAFQRRGTTGAPYTLGDVSNDNSRKMDQKNTFNTTIHTSGDTREAGRILTRANTQTALLLQHRGAIV